MDLIDFTYNKQLFKGYGGANGSKISVIYNGEMYMLKFPTRAKRYSNLHYSNSIISEYVCCKIFKELNFDVQEVLLGKYTTNNKTYNVVACKDFEQNGWRFYDFLSFKNTHIDTATHGRNTNLDNIYKAFKTQNQFDEKYLIDSFWDMFIVDAYIGNWDRHNGNWGFLWNERTNEIKIAPIYDCGSCLFAQADEEAINSVINDDKKAIEHRIYDSPLSAIKIEDKKINYYEFLITTDNQDCIDSLERTLPKIQQLDLDKIIDPIMIIDTKQKEFYKKMLNLRKEKILDAAYESALDRGILKKNNTILKNKQYAEPKRDAVKDSAGLGNTDIGDAPPMR